MSTKSLCAAALALSALAGAAHAGPMLSITVENTQPDSFYFTPLWVGLHDGSFDSYDGGTFAHQWAGLTAIAENGATGPLSDAFDASPAGVAGGVQATITATDGPDGAPVFAPGESTTFVIDAGDASINRYFSYASMIVPSNDLFIANGDPMAHELFDGAGVFSGPVEILIFGSAVNDNGTELNSATNDAAFSVLDGQSIPENVVIRNLFTDPADQDYLDSFVGTGVPTGATIGSSFGPDDLIARITIVPAPSTAGLMGLAGLLAARRRR